MRRTDSSTTGGSGADLGLVGRRSRKSTRRFPGLRRLEVAGSSSGGADSGLVGMSDENARTIKKTIVNTVFGIEFDGIWECYAENAICVISFFPFRGREFVSPNHLIKTQTKTWQLKLF